MRLARLVLSSVATCLAVCLATGDLQAQSESESASPAVVLSGRVLDDATGRGIAGAIVKFGLEHAREKSLIVVPQCSYVAAFVKRHSEYQDLLAT